MAKVRLDEQDSIACLQENNSFMRFPFVEAVLVMVFLVMHIICEWFNICNIYRDI